MFVCPLLIGLRNNVYKLAFTLLLFAAVMVKMR